MIGVPYSRSYLHMSVGKPISNLNSRNRHLVARNVMYVIPQHGKDK